MSSDNLPPKTALPHGKSSFILFKNICFYNSLLVSPPSPQPRSSLLEKMAYIGEKEEDFSCNIQPVEKVHLMCGGASPTPMVPLSAFARRETFLSHRSIVRVFFFSYLLYVI